MFKKITVTIILLSVILLTPINSFAQRGGRGGGGFGGFGGGGGFDMSGGIMGGRGRGSTSTFDANDFRNSTLLTYLVDANNAKVDPNNLSVEQLQTLYNQIGMGTQGGVLDTSRFPDSMTQFGGGRGGMRGVPGGSTMTIDPNDPDPIIRNVSFNGVNITAIISMLMDWTGKSIIPTDDSLGLTITVFSPNTMRRSQAIRLLYSAMREKGYVAEEDGDIIYIKPLTARYDTAPLIRAEESLATILDKETVVQKIFKLKHYSPSSMGQMIIPMIGSYGHVQADENTGTLMVMETVRTLMRIELIIQQFDIDMAGVVTDVIRVMHRDPQEMVEMLEMILDNSSILASGGMMGGMMGGFSIPGITTNTRTSTNRNTTTQNRGRDRGGRGSTSNPLSGIIGSILGGGSASTVTVGSAKIAPVFIPDSRENTIIVKATEDDMEIIRYWVQKLDTEAKIVWQPEELATLGKNEIVQKFYYLQYNSPSQIAQIIDPLLSENGYLSAEENTNTLFIIDTAETLIRIEGIIDRFDVPYAEADAHQIFEVKNGDAREIVELINILLEGEISGTSRTGFGTTGRTTNRTTGRTTTGRNTGGMGGFNF